MNFDDNFRRVGSANIEPIKAMLGEVTAEQWENREARQQLYEAHRAAKAVLLVHDGDFRHIDPTRHPALELFLPVIRPVLGVTADHYDQSPKGVELTRKFGLGYFIRANFLLYLLGIDLIMLVSFVALGELDITAIIIALTLVVPYMLANAIGTPYHALVARMP